MLLFLQNRIGEVRVIRGSVMEINFCIFIAFVFAYRFADLDIENLNEKLYCPKKNEFWSLMAYNNGKLCNLLFASKLHRELYHKGVNVYAVHPGNIIHSNLCRNYWVYRILFSLCSPFTKSLVREMNLYSLFGFVQIHEADSLGFLLHFNGFYSF